MKNIFTIVAIIIGLLGSSVSMADCSTNRNTSLKITKPDSRYLINGDGTVTDKSTQLMWQQCSMGLSGTTCASGTAQTYTWQAALAVASDNLAHGYSDWRLPNIKELSSLHDAACVSPSINETVFPNTLILFYWSASPYRNREGQAWVVNFSTGDTRNRNKSNVSYARLVRYAQ